MAIVAKTLILSLVLAAVIYEPSAPLTFTSATLSDVNSLESDLVSSSPSAVTEK